MRKAISRTSKIVWWGVLLLGLVIAAVLIINRRWIVDWYRGINYTPTTEMAEIRDNLALTDGGTFLFNALRPELGEADEFNTHCHQTPSETAVLGCYTDGAVHIYNITSPELDGILEVTTAHEMLHAVWARMNAAEQESFMAALNQVIAENGEILDSELETYEPDMRMEEAYVRAGTEIAELPEQLEKHFAQYFKDRSKVVNYYNNYIAVFNDNREQAERLEQEIPELKAKITAEIEQYEKTARDLEQRVNEFNRCASTANCFKSQAEFATQRNQLMREQQNLQAQNGQLNGEIADFNAKIDQYNQIVDDSRKLEEEINSNSLTEVDI